MTETEKAKKFEALLTDAVASVPLLILQAVEAGGSNDGSEA